MKLNLRIKDLEEEESEEVEERIFSEEKDISIEVVQIYNLAQNLYRLEILVKHFSIDFVISFVKDE